MKLKDIFESSDLSVADADRDARKLGFEVTADDSRHTYTKTVEVEQGQIDVRYIISVQTESWILDASVSGNNNYIQLSDGEDANGLMRHMKKNLTQSQIRKVFEV
jgi:hypothetical protein